MEGAEVVANQTEEGGPSNKVRVHRKKKTHEAGEKTMSQLREELNLELIHHEVNPEQQVLDQGLPLPNEPNKPNVPLEHSEEVESEKFEKDSDRQCPL